MVEQDICNQYIRILHEELVPAQGCTEPIAIALAAAAAREVLGQMPQAILVRCSGNIIKNAKSVIVPNTGNLRGIEASAIAGAVAGNAAKSLQVLSEISEDEIRLISAMLDSGICRAELLETDAVLHIIVTCQYGSESAMVEIIGGHTNIARVEKNGKVLYEKNAGNDSRTSSSADRSTLTIRRIYEFAEAADITEAIPLLARQVETNLAVAEQGLAGQYGVSVGRLLLANSAGDVFSKARAYAAAGSDARMGGCPLPVITNSGSGNQGLTASLPVIIYAQEKNIPKDKMYRALVLSNLVTVHQKTGLGKLSAFCGAVCAACGSGAGITFLEGGTLEQVDMTITNTLANVSGMVCDGAKASCAAKIASALDAAILAHLLAMQNTSFESNTGIVKETVENTIAAACRLGREGMKETDVEILKIMMEN